MSLITFTIVLMLLFLLVLTLVRSTIIATIYIFRDGTDTVMGRFRKPRHYTRGGLEQTPVLKYGKIKVQE
jgi:hypothetical protein